MAICWMQGRSENAQQLLRQEQYLARSDSNDSSLHLLFVLWDILTFLVNGCGITDYWETPIFEKSSPQIVSPFLQNKQFSDYSYNWLDMHLHCWKVSEHCIVLCDPKHAKIVHVAMSALRCDYNFSHFIERSKRGDKNLSSLRAFSTERLKNLKMLCWSPHWV